MDEVEPEPKPGKYPSLDNILRDDPEPQFLLPCTICNKTFNPESLQRHSKICEKNATRKRKQFDSYKQRVQGTGMAEFLAPVRKEKPSSPRKTVNSWKEKHEAFVSAIRAAKATEATNGKAIHGASGDGRTPVRHSDHEQCPYCGRSFGPKAFDRHIEWCRDQRQRQPPSVASLQARERLEARIKYRAPPCKSKRSLMREKYSPVAQRKVREPSPNSRAAAAAAGSTMTSSLTCAAFTSSSKSPSAGPQKSQPPDPPVRYNRALSSTSNRANVKENNSNQGLNRGGISRTSIRASQRASQRSVSPKKPSSPASAKTSKTPPHRPSSRASNRRSDESLNMMVPTEVPTFNRNSSNTSLTTKRKSQPNENYSQQSQPQIISKNEVDRSRRNSAQRPHDTFPPENPLHDPTEPVPNLRLYHPYTDTLVGNTYPANTGAMRCRVTVSEIRDSSGERKSDSDESNTPYLFSDSSCAGDNDGAIQAVKEGRVCSCPVPSGTQSGGEGRKKTVKNGSATTLKVGLSRKRRRINTPRTPLRTDVYQSRNVEIPAFRVEEIVDLDDLCKRWGSDEEFDVDPSCRGKRTSCSASTYTKDRSSFVDGVLRVSSSEREVDSSPGERTESPEVASPSSIRTARSVGKSLSVARNRARSGVAGNAKKWGKKSCDVTGRRVPCCSRTPSPDKSLRRWGEVKSAPVKLPAVPVPKGPKGQRRGSSDRALNFQPFLAVRSVTLRSPIVPVSFQPPVLWIKNKIPQKLVPLENGLFGDATRSVASEPPKSEMYDPYQSAERQMFELFNSDSAADLSVAAENRKNEEKRASLSSLSISPSHSPSPCRPLETSPTSAFTRYSKESDLEVRSPSPEPAPAPPPRQHRSVSVELPSLTGQPRPPLKTHHSVDGASPFEPQVPPSPTADTPKSPIPFLEKRNSDDRPRTYDIFSKEARLPSPVSPVIDDSPPDILVVIDTPAVSPPITPPPDFVELRERSLPKTKESRESREVREITDKDPLDSESIHDIDNALSQKFLEFSDEISIDNLMEEVARMQQYVSLMSNSSQSRPKHQSAKSRRSRASKLHIEDYLYPANSPMRGTTPIMGDVGNTVLDTTASSDNEDNDVVVSPNALAAALKSEIDPRGDDSDKLLSPVRSKDLGSFSPVSSRSSRLAVEAMATTDARRRLPGDSDDDEVRSARNSPVPRMASNRQSTGSRLSGDSAYSSLNRKSPIPSSKGPAPVRPARQIQNSSPPTLLSQSLRAESRNPSQSRDLSSSSSESSLHAMAASLTSRKSIDSDAGSKLSKFCHDCGTKFPVSSAKFCPECGIRRLGM